MILPQTRGEGSRRASSTICSPTLGKKVPSLQVGRKIKKSFKKFRKSRKKFTYTTNLYKSIKLARLKGHKQSNGYQRYMFERVCSSLRNFEIVNSPKISEKDECRSNCSSELNSTNMTQKSEWSFSTDKGSLTVVYEPPDLERDDFHDLYDFSLIGFSEDSYEKYDYVVEKVDGSKLCYKFSCNSGI